MEEENDSVTRLPFVEPIIWSNLEDMEGTLPERISARRSQVQYLQTYIPFLKELDAMLIMKRDQAKQDGYIVRMKSYERRRKIVLKRLNELESNKDMEDHMEIENKMSTLYAKQREAEATEEAKKKTSMVTKSSVPSAPKLGGSAGVFGLLNPRKRNCPPSSFTSQHVPPKSLIDPSERTMANLAEATRKELQGSGNDSATSSDIMAIIVRAFHNAPVDVVRTSPDVCAHCKIPLLVHIREQMKICSKCSFKASYADDTTASALYPDDMDSTVVKYPRGGHFQEQLTRITGREQVRFSNFEDIKEKLSAELSKEYSSSDEISIVSVGIAAKKLKLKDCYNHLVLITAELTGYPPIQLEPYQLSIVKVFYTVLQKPLETMDPDTTFFPTKYTLLKIAQIFRWHELFPILALTTPPSKVKELDNQWEEYMNHFGWPFVPVYVNDYPQVSK